MEEDNSEMQNQISADQENDQNADYPNNTDNTGNTDNADNVNTDNADNVNTDNADNVNTDNVDNLNTDNPVENVESSGGVTDSLNDSTNEQGTDDKASKLYKTTLCQFYLQGPCKNGDNCQFAHGTSELRTRNGVAVKELSDIKIKVKLCENFLAYGSCPLGSTCTFAHGIRELQKSASTMNINVANNPQFKTSLCRYYMSGSYCPLADKCNFAHGHHELRDKTQVPLKDIPEDIKQRIIFKAKQKPDYKTKLCTRFMESKDCQYGDLCHYAHGEEELQEPKPADSSTGGGMFKKFKTTMCKNVSNCQFGDKCQFAHSQAELRQPKPHSSSYGRGPANGYAPYSNRMMDPKYKTAMCRSVTQNIPCTLGASCSFAHSQMELRSPSMGVQAPPVQSQNSVAFYRYKVTMCSSITSTGQCPRGSSCSFAHSYTEMMQAKQRDPKYKTVLCENFKNEGRCERGEMCSYAHGEGELRLSSYPPPSTGYGPPPSAQTGYPPTHPPQTGYPPTHPTPTGYPPTHPTPTGYPQTHATPAGYGAPAPTSYRPTHPAPGGYGYTTQTPAGYSTTPQTPAGYGTTTHPTPAGYGTAPKAPEGYGTSVPTAESFSHAPPPYGTGSVPAYQPTQRPPVGSAAVNSKYKTVLCEPFMTKGFCEKGPACSFAHGPEELANKENYKTSMCRNITSNGHCTKGALCHFAHDAQELRPAGPTYSTNANYSHSNDNTSTNSNPSYLTNYQDNSSASAPVAKRKQTNTKTVLCQNFQTYGVCQYGNACSFAHGMEELQANKRQRL